MSKALILTANNFQSQVLDSSLPVLVDFWASWCSPCKMMDPAIEALAKGFENKVVIGKVNVDQNPAIASKFSINGVPTFIIFKEGREMDRKVGAQSDGQLRKFIKETLFEVK